MATFSALELSRKDGDPVALYYFKYGAADESYYAYTDADHDISAPGNISGTTVVYRSKPIMRGAISSSGTLDRATMELRAPRDIELTNLFLVYPPSTVVTCVIRQGHLGETDGLYPVCWAGRVMGLAFEKSEAIFNLEPVITSLRRTGLRRNYQYGCPHVLYGSQCMATEVTSQGTVASVSANVVTLNSGWNGVYAADKFVNGMMRWTTATGNTQIRTILSISGNVFTLNGIVQDLSVGDTVYSILGCNHQPGYADSTGDCKNLHNNILNFGGQPWIPKTNPTGATSPYYGNPTIDIPNQN